MVMVLLSIGTTYLNENITNERDSTIYLQQYLQNLIYFTFFLVKIVLN